METPNETPRRDRIRFDELTLQDLLRDWRDLSRDCLEEAERFVRERPLEALASTLLAGAVLGALLGRRK